MYFFDKLRVQKNTIKRHYSFISYNNNYIIGINSPTSSMFFFIDRHMSIALDWQNISVWVAVKGGI